MEWSDAPHWIAIGLAGQAAFFSRFLVQWIASERAGASVVPRAFWHLSLVGSLVLLVYSIHRREPILALGYVPNAVVYLRNLALLRRNGAAASAALGSAPPD
jgi:lipid-A-disaccharide synthase-like uncharacterized protein